MTEAQKMAERINEHRRNGGRVWAVTAWRAAEVGEAFAEGESLFIRAGRHRRPLCVLPAVTADLRRNFDGAFRFR
ncbi:hypothetical protein [Elioraea sp.]|uniref:hypothetical protein n=1 Tax=Elioraea sp. TaxID=2185103 RepID=UPI003F70A7EB